jgi:hypothetical protein
VPHATARRWLWIAALLTMPVPFYLGQLEWAPVLRLGFLTLLFGAVALAEGGGTVIALCVLGLVQAAVYASLFRMVADLGARGLLRFAPEPLRAAAVGSAVFLLVMTAQLPIYETPLSSTRLRSNLWQLFE